MGTSSTRTFVVPPTEAHSATVIFLHGLGDTGEGWSEAFRSIAAPSVRYVCPTAPTMPVTLNGGFAMPSWFDIFGLGAEAQQDEKGIKASSATLRKLIDEEITLGVSPARIFIGGFSQGGAVALHTALTDQRQFAGVLALSTWLPLHDKIAAAATENGRQTPILQCHGDSDPMVSLQVGQMTGAFLQKFSARYQMKIYPGLSHSSSPKELEDVRRFLNEQLAKDSAL